MEDKAYSKEPLKGKKEHTWFKKIGNSYHTDWSVFFDELSDDWKIIIDKFCNDIFNATSYNIKIENVSRDVKLHIRDEDKKAFLIDESKKVIEEIRNSKKHEWLGWQPSTVKDENTLKLALKKAFWKMPSAFRTEYEQNISKNPDFKFESPSLVDYIFNLELLNYIDSWLNPKQTNEPIRNIKKDKIINLLVRTEIKPGKTFIPNNLEHHFTSLLEIANIVCKTPKWPYSDWMLFVIIKSFIDNSILNIEEKEIPGFMFKHFTFASKEGKNIIESNYNRAKNGYKYSDFTTKLAEVYNKL